MKKHNKRKTVIFCCIFFIFSLYVSATFSKENKKNIDDSIKSLSSTFKLASLKKMPSFMFMIAEQSIDKEFYVYWWGSFFRHGNVEFRGKQIQLSVSETILKEEFLNYGFDVIDISNASDKIRISSAYKLVDLTKSAAMELGKDCGADIVVKGKALARRGPVRAGSSVGTYLADITATAFYVRGGLVVGAGRGHGVSRHISAVSGGSQALERASKKLAEKLIEQINEKVDFNT